MNLSMFFFAASCLVLSGLLNGVTAVLLWQSEASSYDAYVTTFSRTWEVGTEEYEVHQRAFQRRLEFITAHNANPNRRWTAGLNHLSDNTEQEFSMRLGSRRYNRGGGAGDFSLLEMHENSDVKLADEINWNNLTHAVPDQGGCGSCWAVATVSMMDAHAELHGMKGHSFSVQDLVDCTPNPRECGGSGGCQGATVELAMKYIEKKGLRSTSEKPYQAKDGTCKYPLDNATAATFLELASNEVDFVRPSSRQGHSGLSVAFDPAGPRPVWGSIALKGWVTLPSNKAGPLMRAVMEGPVAISVGASAWQSYQGGVFDGCDNDTVIDHAVTLFGYGRDEKTSSNYWNIRNSWGPTWGEDGYIRIFRSATTQEDDAACGTDHEPEKGIECKPYPKEVTVCGMCGLLYDSVAITFRNTSSGAGSGSVSSSGSVSAGSGIGSAAGIGSSSTAVTSF